MKEKLKRQRQESIICQTVIPQREQKKMWMGETKRLEKIESQKGISKWENQSS